eukprot:11867942-Ditylum_brightwellii.AAC.2
MLSISLVIVGVQGDLNVGFGGSSAAASSASKTLQYAVAHLYQNTSKVEIHHQDLLVFPTLHSLPALSLTGRAALSNWDS